MGGGSDEKMVQQQEGEKIEELKDDYIPMLRSGSWADIGLR